MEEITEPLLEEIRLAFKSTIQPPSDQIDDAYGLVVRRFGDRHWSELTYDDIVAVRGSLSSLYAPGICHYLPALMSFLIAHPDDGDVLHDSIVNYLRVPELGDADYLKSVFPHVVRCLSEEQKQVAAEFLKLYLSDDPRWETSLTDSRRLKNSIRFWKG